MLVRYFLAAGVVCGYSRSHYKDTATAAPPAGLCQERLWQPLAATAAERRAPRGCIAARIHGEWSLAHQPR